MKNVLLLVAAALFCIGYPVSSRGSTQYVKVGCFRDKPGPRALPELLFSYRGKIDWSNLKQIVEDCAEKTKKKNYMYFGIQFYGECWSGAAAFKTYDHHGRSSKCTDIVGKANANLVYRLGGDENECKKYSVLNSMNRSATFDSPKAGRLSCDKEDLSYKWYRFQPPAGNQMASTCVPTRKCGTAVTGWLETTHPKVTDGIVNGKVCFNWATCCQHKQYIQVRNCGRFFVYKLAKTFSCPMRFCGETSK